MSELTLQKSRILQASIINKTVIEPHSGCWVWLASRGQNGYGKIHIKRVTRTAHSVSYEVFVGAIPHGLEIDHKCCNKWCANPEHLEAVTHAENVKRQPHNATRRIAATCNRGHELDGVRTRTSGGRYCRTCVRLNKRLQRQRAKSREPGETGN